MKEDVVGFAVDIPVAFVCQYIFAFGAEYVKVAAPQDGLAEIFMVPAGALGIAVTFTAPETLLVTEAPQAAETTQ